MKRLRFVSLSMFLLLACLSTSFAGQAITGNLFVTGEGGFTGTITANNVSARITRRVVSIVSSATPAINSDATDLFIISALATDISSMTSSLTGTPVDGDLLEIRILDDGTARTITWGSSFASTTITLPTTTVISTTLRILLEWNAATSKWECIAVT